MNLKARYLLGSGILHRPETIAADVLYENTEILSMRAPKLSWGIKKNVLNNGMTFHYFPSDRERI